MVLKVLLQSVQAGFGRAKKFSIGLVETFFDDFKITHTKSPIISADDYYPFGLQIAQHSYQRESATPQKYKFQGQEHQDDLGLGWVQFKWRMHDPAIGRFMVVDPLAEDYVHNSPYAFSEKKVTAHIELEGLEAFSVATSTFMLQTHTVANANSGGNPGVGDFIRAAAQVAFFSTRIGGGLAKFSQGAQLKVANTGDFAQNAGSNIQKAIDSGTDPNAIQQNFEQVDTEANALMLEGGADIALGAAELQFQLATGAMSAGSSSATAADASNLVRKSSPFDLQTTHGLTKSKKQFSLLKADIKEKGITESIKFVEHNGTKFVVDGHHRLRAAKELGIKEVPIEQVQLPFRGYKSVDDLIYSY